MSYFENSIIRDTAGDQLDITAAGAAKVDGSAVTQPVSNVNLDAPLSTIATEATLADIEAGIPESLGQQVMADSMPVVIASDQTPIPVSGTVTITPSGTQVVSATDLDIRDLDHTQDSVRIGDGTDLAEVTAAGELNVIATAQPGVDIGDVTVNNGAGASAVNIQDGGNSITVDGPLTDAELRATPVPVSATNLDIRDLVFASDKVDVSGSSVTADTELPAAAALADNTANPTAPAVGSFGHVWDGANWDRIPGNQTDGVKVNLGADNDVSLNAGTNFVGYVGHGKTLKTVTSGATPITADTDIISAVALKRLKIIGYAFFTDSTTQNIITLKSNGTGGTALWTVPLQSPAAGAIFGANLATDAPSFLFATAAGEKLTADVSAAVNVWYSIVYYDDDAT